MANESTPLVAVANGNGDSQTPAPPAHSWGKWWLTLGGVVVLLVLLLLGAAFYGGTTLVDGSGDHDDAHPSKHPSKKEQRHPHILHVHESTPNDDYATRMDDDDAPRSGSGSETGENAPPKYVATQFLSFTINTIGGVADKDECQGRPVDPHNGFCYLGNADNITEDVFHRLSIVEQILQRIQQDAFVEHPDIDHSDDVLKIVMIPEFFWRGPNGAYSTDWMLPPATLFLDLGNRLRALVADDFFSDFLFVFGTAIAASTPGDPRKPWELTENDISSMSAKNIEYYNFATVHKGGSTHRHRYVVTKKYISGADFLSRTTLPNPKDENKNFYGAIGDELSAVFEAGNVTLITDNILELDGLRIGLEICLDHRMGTLWNHIKTHRLPLVDILLVTSAGMAIERGPNPVVPGGVVYLCDGDASSAACMRTDDHVFHPEAVCRGDVGGLKHIPMGGPGYTNFFALSACWDMENSDLLKGYYSMYQPQGCAYTLKTYDIDVMDEFAYYPPSIEIYPTVKLADSAYKN